jgi:hypothetical protein
MSSFSNFLELELLDHVFGGGDYSRPATLYIALCTAAPTDASTGSTLTEANYTGYARKAFTNNSTNFPAASSGSKSNGVAITFNPCTGGSSTVTHFAIVDAASNGNVLGWGALTASLAVSNGITPEFAIGALTITLD